ncbi:unnamed protein product [Schistosoma mattheei]|uniref:Uncharacterized protein n=1 Tax=Schistosoma mattheei TaxID=31246 RepID=A0A183NNA3_9TREM|nr:unnamed protein product [Schistosoma mattheei]
MSPSSFQIMPFLASQHRSLVLLRRSRLLRARRERHTCTIPRSSQGTTARIQQVTSLNNFQGIDPLKLAQLQKEDTDPQLELSSTILKLRIKQMGTSKETLLCDTSTGWDRTIMPKHCRRNTFNT